MDNASPGAAEVTGGYSQDSNTFSSGRSREGTGLFDSLGAPSTSRSLFPQSTLSVPSNGLFGFPFNSPKTPINSDASPAEPKFEIEQTDSTNIKTSSNGLSSANHSYSFGLWSWRNNITHQSGLFSALSTRVSSNDHSRSPNLFSGMVASPGSPALNPCSSNLSAKSEGVEIAKLPITLPKINLSNSEGLTALTRRTEKQLSSFATPMMIRLDHISPDWNQEPRLRNIFAKFGEIEEIICQPSVSTALIAFSDFDTAQKAKSEIEGLIPGVVAYYESFPCHASGSLSSSLKKPSSLPDICPSSETQDSTVLGMLSTSTVEERLIVLGAKDKAEHERRQVTCGTLSDGQAITVGTCPDMCPETERYLRELRQRVSVFECRSTSSPSGPLQMDHTLAVKDYSRSAADQAEPLPWELRPPEVLQRTMNYLLAAIANRPEIDGTGNLWKPWYEFLWTRTRAIRKDITQQRLCSPVIVSIVEKITRFHIFCAARLVDQPMDTFDPRINSENLTQCLQTLKELYGDLRGAGGGTAASAASLCPCEPEFRAYMIIMKLNDCSVLNEVQKFPEALRKSAEVQFAIAVHSAVAELNHVRFFRLVRSADCLTACLLHRYFSQVRSHALFALSAAFFGHPRHEVAFPLSAFAYQLGFESRNDAEAFCEHWNLQVCGDDLIFKRHSPPREPELAWQERRAPHLIESKRENQSLADLFNGGPIDPSYAKPGPVYSSFDGDGHLLPMEEVQELPYYPSPTNCVPISEIEPGSPTMPIEDLSNADAFSELQHRKTAFNPDSVFTYPSEIYLSGGTESKAPIAIFDDLLDDEIRRVVTVDLSEFKAVESVSTHLIEEAIQLYTVQIVEKEVDMCLSRISSAAEEVADGIIGTTLDDLLLELILDVIDEDVVAAICGDLLMEALSRLASRVLRKTRSKQMWTKLLLRRTFYAWKAACLCGQRRNSRTDGLRHVPAAPAPRLWLGDLNSEGIPGCRRIWLQALPTSVKYAFKRARLASYTTEGDMNLALQPHTTFPDFRGAKIGVIVNTGPHLFLQWLSAKLQNYENLIFIPSVDCLSGTEAGLVIVGNVTSSLAVPQLHLYPAELKESVEQSDTSMNISFPPLAGGFSTVAYCWSRLLQFGLQWLVERMVVAEDGGGTTMKTTTTATLPRPSFLQSSTLAELVSARVQTAFLTPLLDSIDRWTEQGLTHPDPRRILTAYNQCLDPLPKHIQASLIIHPLPDPISPDTSWSNAVNSWHSFLLTAQFQELTTIPELSLNRCEQWRQVSAMLVPWGSLCVRLVWAKLDATLNDEKQTLTTPNTAEAVPTPVQHSFDQLGPQFSVSTIVHQFRSGPSIVRPGDGERPPPQKPFSPDALIRQLHAVDAKINKISDDARSILK